MLEYRKATFNDVEAIHKLCNHYATLGLMLPRSRNSIYENLRDYIVAVEGDKVIGCGALHFVWDRLAEIRSLAIDPDKQKTGIGKEIVALLEKSGIEKGTQMFFTLTYQPGFFIKCGYEESDKENLPQKVWKECVYCPQYPNCNELAFVKILPGYKPPKSKLI
ncbi:Amino-acid acetyltransferase [bioreactor metagenome]|jgi:N-acetylglutamate synthase and related acetyltransferases|uniref:Amino-acid acetyltransferase n=1 Tax=bioreactor metagenome TaxID=1076179 RepID=A0A644VKY0_9ZZZZ|nr:N-acetyltransferase [Acidaminococcaceae bacterium]